MTSCSGATVVSRENGDRKKKRYAFSISAATTISCANGAAGGDCSKMCDTRPTRFDLSVDRRGIVRWNSQAKAAKKCTTKATTRNTVANNQLRRNATGTT